MMPGGGVIVCPRTLGFTRPPFAGGHGPLLLEPPCCWVVVLVAHKTAGQRRREGAWTMKATDLAKSYNVVIVGSWVQ